MAASLEDIMGWFDRGVKEGASHMIVVCDSFSYEDYPVYVAKESEFYTVYAKYNGVNMQRIMEVYDLSESKESQKSGRVMNVPNP